MPGTPVITARNVGKRYRSYGRPATSLKEAFLRRGGKPTDFWALRDIDLEIRDGETVGLMGANGSGKSTLLKILSDILKPTTGDVRVQGRIASLLELGAGFNSELSGRDNVYLNGALLGLTVKDIDALFDDIVGFAELEDFIDDPVKNYSSGMYVRLGFAVAVNVEPDILLVDEVLAVGDEAFQEKCLGRIARFQREGRTILFVSHALDLVERLCTRGVVLDHGRLIFAGDPEYATGTLRGILHNPGEHRGGEDPAEQQLVIESLRYLGGTTTARGLEFAPGENVSFDIDLLLRDATLTGDLKAVITGAGGIPVAVLMAQDAMPDMAGRHTVRFEVGPLPELYGGFTVAFSIHQPGMDSAWAARHFHDVFWVVGRQRAGLLRIPFTMSISRSGDADE